MKSHVAYWLINQLTCATTSALQTRNSALSFEMEYQQLHQIQELCYYSENKAKIVLSFSLTAIKYFHAKLHPTNICSMTGRLFVGIIQARCFTVCWITISEYSPDIYVYLLALIVKYLHFFFQVFYNQM